MKELSYVLTKNFVACVPVRFYSSLPLIFTSLAASISHFLTAAGVTAAVKFLFFCHDEIRVLCLTRSSSFSDIHVGVDIKSNVEEDSTLLFFLFKCQGGHTISCQVKPWVAFGMPYLLIELFQLVCLWYGRMSGHVTITFLGYISNHIFLLMVLVFYIKQFLQFTELESYIFIVKGLNLGVIS